MFPAKRLSPIFGPRCLLFSVRILKAYERIHCLKSRTPCKPCLNGECAYKVTAILHAQCRLTAWAPISMQSALIIIKRTRHNDIKILFSSPMFAMVSCSWPAGGVVFGRKMRWTTSLSHQPLKARGSVTSFFPAVLYTLPVKSPDFRNEFPVFWYNFLISTWFLSVNWCLRWSIVFLISIVIYWFQIDFSDSLQICLISTLLKLVVMHAFFMFITIAP